MSQAGRVYENDIRGSCGPCDCPSLADLKGMADRIGDLEKACRTYVSEGALAHLDNPVDEEYADLAFTQAYADTYNEWEGMKKSYDLRLHQKAKKGDIVFFLHNPDAQAMVRTMPYAEVQRELHLHRNDLAPFITINCAHCHRNWGVAV
jgi:hypothetical protein